MPQLEPGPQHGLFLVRCAHAGASPPAAMLMVFEIHFPKTFVEDGPDLSQAKGLL
jgi:hypothetical protein